MQINFNPHLPPGYFETHELDGMSWKSERPVREALRERAVAGAVKKFERDSRQEMERQRRTNTCRTIQKIYTVRNVNLKIIRYPWERIPSVLINRKRTPTAQWQDLETQSRSGWNQPGEGSTKEQWNTYWMHWP